MTLEQISDLPQSLIAYFNANPDDKDDLLNGRKTSLITLHKGDTPKRYRAYQTPEGNIELYVTERRNDLDINEFYASQLTEEQLNTFKYAGKSNISFVIPAWKSNPHAEPVDSIVYIDHQTNTLESMPHYERPEILQTEGIEVERKENRELTEFQKSQLTEEQLDTLMLSSDPMDAWVYVKEYRMSPEAEPQPVILFFDPDTNILRTANPESVLENEFMGIPLSDEIKEKLLSGERVEIPVPAQEKEKTDRELNQQPVKDGNTEEKQADNKKTKKTEVLPDHENTGFEGLDMLLLTLYPVRAIIHNVKPFKGEFRKQNEIDKKPWRVSKPKLAKAIDTAKKMKHPFITISPTDKVRTFAERQEAEAHIKQTSGRLYSTTELSQSHNEALKQNEPNFLNLPYELDKVQRKEESISTNTTSVNERAKEQVMSTRLFFSDYLINPAELLKRLNNEAPADLTYTTLQIDRKDQVNKNHIGCYKELPDAEAYINNQRLNKEGTGAGIRVFDTELLKSALSTLQHNTHISGSELLNAMQSLQVEKSKERKTDQTAVKQQPNQSESKTEKKELVEVNGDETAIQTNKKTEGGEQPEPEQETGHTKTFKR